MAKRTDLTKRIRFEVFKRDKFTCQYCGQESPEVILNVDHVDPVANGGGYPPMPIKQHYKDRMLDLHTSSLIDIYDSVF